MDGRDLLVIGSLIPLAISVLLAFLGFPQIVVSALIGGVSADAGILWKWSKNDHQADHQVLTQVSTTTVLRYSAFDLQSPGKPKK